MDLDALLGASRPVIEGPSAAVVAEHRARLEARLQDPEPGRESGPASAGQRWRTPRRWLRPFDGRRAAAITAAAVVLLLVVGLVAAGLFNQRNDRRTVVADTGSTTTEQPTSSAPTTTTSSAPASTPATGPAPDDGRPTAEGAIGGLDPADALCGVALPAGVEILPGPVDAIEPLEPRLPGQLAQRIRRGSTTVEYRWPAVAPLIYAEDDGEAPRWPDSAAPIYRDGTVRLFQGRDPAIEPDREPVEDLLPDLGPEPSSGELRQDGTEVWVVDWLSEELLRQPDGLTGLTDDCHELAIEVFQDDQLVNRFGWDLTADPAIGFPIAPLEPLITESRLEANPPTEAVLCDGGPDFPNEQGTGDGSTFARPVDALIDYLGQPRDTAFSSSFVELIASDERYVYVDAARGGTVGALVVTVEAQGDGTWALTAWNHSGC